MTNVYFLSGDKDTNLFWISRDDQKIQLHFMKPRRRQAACIFGGHKNKISKSQWPMGPVFQRLQTIFYNFQNKNLKNDSCGIPGLPIFNTTQCRMGEKQFFGREKTHISHPEKRFWKRLKSRILYVLC